MAPTSNARPQAALRLARPADAAAIAAVYAPNITRSVASFEVTPPTPEEMAQRIAKVQALAPWLVCESNGAVCGYAYASRHHERTAYQWALDAAVYIAADHQRRGIGRALYTSLFELVRLQGFYSAHAGITLPNQASVGLHESLGFRSVGVYKAVGYKFGGWHDVGWWQLELRPRVGEPAPLKAPEAVRAEQPEAWQAALDLGRALLT